MAHNAPVRLRLQAQNAPATEDHDTAITCAVEARAPSRLGAAIQSAGLAIRRLPVTLAALTCTGVGVGYNAEFAAQFGTGAVALAVASDVLKSASGPALRRSVAEREWIKATASIAVLALTLTVSIVAAFGSAQHRREDATDGRANDIRAYDDAARRKAALETEVAALGSTRPMDVIQAAINGAPVTRAVWLRSKGCADISRDDTRKACEPVLKLYQERGAAARKLEIETALSELRPTLAKGRPQHADPQARALASLTGLSEDAVRLGISALIVALIEFGAIGGWVMASGPVKRRNPGAPGTPGTRRPVARTHVPSWAHLDTTGEAVPAPSAALSHDGHLLAEIPEAAEQRSPAIADDHAAPRPAAALSHVTAAPVELQGKIVALSRANGGRVPASTRGLSRMIEGVSKSTVARCLAAMVAAGVLMRDASGGLALATN